MPPLAPRRRPRPPRRGPRAGTPSPRSATSASSRAGRRMASTPPSLFPSSAPATRTHATRVSRRPRGPPFPSPFPSVVAAVRHHRRSPPWHVPVVAFYQHARVPGCPAWTRPPSRLGPAQGRPARPLPRPAPQPGPAKGRCLRAPARPFSRPGRSEAGLSGLLLFLFDLKRQTKNFISFQITIQM